MTFSRDRKEIKIMTQEEIITKLKILKVTSDIDNHYIADYLGMKNARSVANFLHNDYRLSEEKQRKAEELICDLWLDS